MTGAVVGHHDHPCPCACFISSSSDSAAGWSCSPGHRPSRTPSCSCCSTRSPCCAGPIRDPGLDWADRAILAALIRLLPVAAAHPAVQLHVVLDNYGTHKHPRGPHVARPAGEQADHPALHPDQLLLAEHGRDLLRHHHPPGHPPRHLPLRQGPHRRHRRLQRPLPAIRLDQRRRRTHRENQTVKELTPHDTRPGFALQARAIDWRRSRSPHPVIQADLRLWWRLRFAAASYTLLVIRPRRTPGVSVLSSANPIAAVRLASQRGG
jgi:hypothetical protein